MSGRPASRDAHRRDARRPVELLGAALGIAIVVGVIVLAATHRILEAGIWAGVAFVVILVVVAMLMLATNPHSERDDDEDRPPAH